MWLSDTRRCAIAIAHVQSISTYSTGNLTLNGVGVANLLVAWMGSSASVAAVTHSGGGTWTGGPDANDGSSNFTRVNYCLSATGGDTTVTPSSTPGDFGWALFEYSGGTFSYDQHEYDINAVSSLGLTLAAGALSFGYLLDESGGSLPSAYGTHTVRQTQSAHLDAEADYVVPGAGSYAFSVTRGTNCKIIGQATFTVPSGVVYVPRSGAVNFVDPGVF